MEYLIIVSGILAGVRAYWVFNLLRIERGIPKANIWEYFNDKNWMQYYLYIRPFYKKVKDERLKKKINIISYIIYLFFFSGFFSLIMNNDII